MKEIIGGNIKRIWNDSKHALSLKGFDLNIKIFSEKTGIPERTLYAYMNGDAEPSLSKGKMIADFLGVNINELFIK